MQKQEISSFLQCHRKNRRRQLNAMLSPRAGDNFAPYISALEIALSRRYK